MEGIKKLILVISILVITVILFLFIKALYCQFWFSTVVFSNVVEPLDILNILISGAIAIWLGWYITKKLTEQRFLKEFIIKDIYRIEEQIESFEKLVHSDNAQITAIFNELHDLKHKIERFERTTRLTPFSCNEVKYLNNCHTQLFKISTEKTILPTDSRNELKKVCDEFIVCLRKIICTINNR